MRIPVRIYYEDTDCGGVVYYANYLKYFERGRTEYLRSVGISLPELHKKGVVFVVRRAEADYLSPSVYGDLLHIDTRVSGTTRATITFEHTVTKEGSDDVVVSGVAVLAAVSARDGRPVRLPDELRAVL